MESVFGLVGKDFVLLAADCKVVRSILVYKDDEDKVRGSRLRPPRVSGDTYKLTNPPGIPL
jgi:hypothetical protein